MIAFRIDGDPIPQPRPQVTRTGRVYVKDNGIYSYRHAIQKYLVENGERLIQGPVAVELLFVFERPPSHYTATGRLAKGSPGVPTGCDIDNLMKGVFDSLNGLAIKDDRWIGKATLEKRFGPEAYTEVRIWQHNPTADSPPKKSKSSKGSGPKAHRGRPLPKK